MTNNVAAQIQLLMFYSKFFFFCLYSRDPWIPGLRRAVMVMIVGRQTFSQTIVVLQNTFNSGLIRLKAFYLFLLHPANAREGLIYRGDGGGPTYAEVITRVHEAIANRIFTGIYNNIRVSAGSVSELSVPILRRINAYSRSYFMLCIYLSRNRTISLDLTKSVWSMCLSVATLFEFRKFLDFQGEKKI